MNNYDKEFIVKVLYWISGLFIGFGIGMYVEMVK